MLRGPERGGLLSSAKETDRILGVTSSQLQRAGGMATLEIKGTSGPVALTLNKATGRGRNSSTGQRPLHPVKAC